ncbi:hypothetical protein XENOCAPTIV_024553, partial [Xenoophorus captivus]
LIQQAELHPHREQSVASPGNVALPEGRVAVAVTMCDLCNRVLCLYVFSVGE